MFFDQQSSAASQVNLSHSATQTSSCALPCLLVFSACKTGYFGLWAHFIGLHYFAKQCFNCEHCEQRLLSIFQVFNVTDGGLHVVPWFMVQRERSGVFIRPMSQSPIRSTVCKRTRFAIRRQSVHLFFFVQEREFHFNFNCITQTCELENGHT